MYRGPPRSTRNDTLFPYTTLFRSMAFVLDVDGSFERHANPESIVWQRLGSTYWEGVLKALVEEHASFTDSKWSAAILHDWDRRKGDFWQVCPKEMVSRLTHPLSDKAEVIAAE